ncbi:MAG: PKD domain-containing protein, partial [Methanoregulaceae archaeon]
MKKLLCFLCALTLLVMPALADTTTFYADTADDGRLSRTDVIENFSDIRSGAGTQASLTSNVNESSFLLTTGSSSGKWITMRGFYWKASTAGIPDDAIIDSATMGFSSTSNCYSGLGTLNITLSNFTEADTGTGLTADDYNTLSGLVLSDTKTMTQWNVDGYKKFTLNANGLSAINKTGNTTIALNFWNTLTNTTPAWSASRSSYCYVYDTSNGTATRPYLNVTYHINTATLAADFSASRTSGGYNAPIRFNESSTGFIESYHWSFGDGNQSTLQNPLFVYSRPGTYTVNLTVTNSTASDSRVKTNYIRIDTRPDTYVNPYHVMIPWLQQGSQSWCAAFAATNAFMILRYTALGVPPAATPEPFTRNVLYYVSGVPVYSDNHVDYTPSASSIYWTFDNLSMGDHDNVTALAETMKRGYNLQTDKITTKSGGPVNYYYPMGAAYETSHRYNPITRYTIMRGGTQSSWDSLKRNISDNGVVVILLDYYFGSGNDTSKKVIIDGETAIQMAEPIGPATNAHALAAIGYNNTEDLVYVLNSWGEVRSGGYRWTKLGAISKSYWMHGSRSAFIVPKNITMNEVLVPMGSTNLTNSTANCTNISFSWNNPLHTDFNHTYTLKNNVWAGNYSKTTTSVVWDGLPETTEYTFSARTCDREGHCNTTWVNKTVTTATCGLQAVAAFSANTLTTCAGEPVTFTDESTQIPTGWYWELGDGNTSTTQSPVYTYDVIGSMSVNLKAMNEYGFSWKNKTGYLTVSDCSPPPSPARFYAN